MKVKYDVLYTSGEVCTTFKGVLTIEQAQNEAIRLSRLPNALKVVYTFQEEVVNLGELENLYEKVIQHTDISAAYKLLNPEILHKIKNNERYEHGQNK
nr:MAG TPA: hypothetical protein [Crassvirales sp.]